MPREDNLSDKKAFYDELYALDESDGSHRDAAWCASMATLREQVMPSLSSPLHIPVSNKRARDTAMASSPLLGNEVTQPVKTKLQTRHSIAGATALEKSITNMTNKVTHLASKQTNDPMMARQPESKKLFDGLQFYFFPNNDTHPGRKFRIKKATEFGATWQKNWSSKVTHIVVDRSMNYGQVLAFLKLDSIPPSIVIVDEVYPADCISFRTILDPSQRQYHIKGFVAPQIELHQSTIVPQGSSHSDISLQLKPASKAFQAREPQTPPIAASGPIDRQQATRLDDPGSQMAKERAAHDIAAPSSRELDEVIYEAKRLKHMPLDFDDDDDDDDTSTRANSEDETFPDREGEPPLKKMKADNGGWQAKFQCMQEHTGKNDAGSNASTIALLQEMADYYTQIKDQWRPMAYRKAIAQLRNHPVKVTTKEDALKLPYVGIRLAEKIEEIAYTNHLRRLDNAKLEPTDQVLQLFIKVYGAGFAVASRWVDQGFRTLDDLRNKANLSENQKVGLAHYEDFEARIPRSEVAEHAAVVESTALSIDRDLNVITMGSYRRGAETSGDIDVIITHPTPSLTNLQTVVFDRLVPELFKQDFLKVTLASTHRSDGTKWHGASCLHSSKTWRRIDLLVVPKEELGAALLYFTGNDIFNRSMRLLARKKGMRLNQKGLFKDVFSRRGKGKATDGELIEGADERKIFNALGVPWREPWQRLC